MNRLYLTLVMLLFTILGLNAQVTVTFDDPPETPLTELPQQMYFTLSEAMNGNPPEVVIKSATQEKKLPTMREGSDYARYYSWVSYYVKDELLAEIQEAGEFSLCITLCDGTVLDPIVFKLKKPITVTFDNDPATPLTELPQQMYFTLSEAMNGNPPEVVIKSATQEKKLMTMRDGSDYARYYTWVSYYVKGDLLAEIQEAGEFSLCITLCDGTVLDPIVFKLKKPITVTFDNDPATPLTELPQQMYFTLSEAMNGNPPEVVIKSATQEKKLMTMRDGSDYARYYTWVSYYVKDELLAEIQEAGEFSLCITLCDGTVLDPVVFKLKKPITVTFDNDPATPLTELPQQMYFTLSEAMNGNPPEVVIKSATQEKKLMTMRDGSDYARYYTWVSYYVKGDLLAEIQEAGEFSLCITLCDGTVLDPVVFKLKKPITVTFDNDPATPLTELPQQMYFTLSEAMNGNPPEVVIKSATQEKKLMTMREGSDYARYYTWVSYYVKGDLLAEIQEAGEFSLCITLCDGTVLDPVVFKLKKAEEPYEATFSLKNGSVFAGIPEQIHFSLNKDVPDETTPKALVNGTRSIDCKRNADSARDFYISGSDILAEDYADGKIKFSIIMEEGADPAGESEHFVVPANISWTPVQGNEDGSTFSSLPTSLAYVLSNKHPEGGYTEAGILLSESDKTEWDINVPYTVIGDSVKFDLKAISGEDILKIEENEGFTVAFRLANKTLSASYIIKARKQTVTLGYCDSELADNMQKLGSEGAASVVGGAIRIPSAKLESLKGGTITKVRFAMDEGLERVYAWIRPSLSEPALVMKKVEPLGKGWHEVEFDTPYTITGDEIFIGYSGHQPVGVKAILAGGPDRPDACWLGIKDNWEDHSNKGYGSLYIQAIGEAILPAVDLGVDNLKIDKEYYRNDETVKASYTVLNSGADEVKGYTVSWKVDDAEPVVITVNEPIASDSRKDSTIDIPLEGLSDGIHTLTVTCSVTDNGKTDMVSDNDAATADIAVYSESFKHTVLLEQFTTINCNNCPKGTNALKKATESRDNVAWIAHHVGFGVDEFTVEESQSLLNCGILGAPSLMIDRTVFSGSNPPITIGYADADEGAKLIGSYIDRSAEIPAFAEVSVTNDYNDATRELTVTVTGKRNAIFSTFTPQCNYTVVLTEDNLKGKIPQQGASGEYVHNHVIRKFITPAFGTPVEWTDDAFSFTTTVELDKSWKAYDMNIVAALNKPFDSTALGNIQVVNSAVSHVNAVSGVDGILTDSDIHIDADGSIIVEGLSEIEVYTPSGIRISNRNLSTGVYILRAIDASGKAVVKKTYVR